MRRIPAEQRREELIAAAIRVIAERGVGAATTRAIATEAGMPLGSIHYIFASHDELLRAVIATVIDEERLTAELRSVAAGTLEDAVRAGLESYIDLLEADPSREIALFELALVARRQDASGQMRTQWAAYYATAEAILDYAADLTGSEWTTPLPELAHHLIVVIDGITTTWLADADGAAARRTAAFAAAAFAGHARPRSLARQPAEEAVHAH
jgi:AcrR family transcriptional regulator